MNANPPRRGLGRGLGSLIPTAPSQPAQTQTLTGPSDAAGDADGPAAGFAPVESEGTPAGAIEAWVIAHGGEPETLTSAAPAPGVHGSRPGATAIADRRPPRRYVLPAAALVARPVPDASGAAAAIAPTFDAGFGPS